MHYLTERQEIALLADILRKVILDNCDTSKYPIKLGILEKLVDTKGCLTMERWQDVIKTLGFEKEIKTE